MKKILSLILALFIAMPTMAQEPPKVTLDVYASKSAVKAGESFDIAIRQNIIEGWHTYWTNPGDSGEGMSITWNAPKGVAFSNIMEPTPERVEYAPLVNFGHYDRPIFIQNVTLPNTLKGDVLELSGEAFWLVCDDICIPESQTISLSIPINDNGMNINQSLFKTARAAMPVAVDWGADIRIQNDEVQLNVAVPADLHNQMTDVEIFPYDWGIIKTTSQVMTDIADESVTFIAQGDGRDISDLKTSDFIIKTDNAAYQVTATLGASAPTQNYSFLLILAFAFLGGLILNLMPCVFPVLSMKALSLVKLSDKDKGLARKSGLAYTLGVVGSFVLIAGLLIALKGAGETIGWGFQLQNPYVVSALATLLFLIGLNLMGLFEISGRFTSFGSNLTTGNDTKSSFFTGVLATLVATPCTAPFMGAAIGYALTQSAFVGLLVFAMLGFGLAFPYLLLTYVPAFQRILPKPGAWMDTFKQALAFPMFASAIWLVWVLAQQAGDLAIIYILGLFLAILFILWFVKKSKSKLCKVIIIAFLAGFFVAYASILAPKSDMNYVPFDQQKLDAVLIENPGQPVFVNMTAAWCITCLVNERTSLSKTSVTELFERENVLYMKGDWTNRDDHITKYLEKYGRNGVPLYVFYGQADSSGNRPDAKILPQILTPEIVRDSLKGE